MFCTNKIPVPMPNRVIHAPLFLAYEISEGMVEKGHNVTLFASSDSKTKAKLVSNNIPSLWKDKSLRKYIHNERVVQHYELALVLKIFQLAEKGEFDIIHMHPYERGIHFAPLVKTPIVFTLHNPIGHIEKFLFSQYRKYPNIYFVSISNSQRRPIPNLNYIDTVYEGVEIERYPFCNKPEDYIVQIGRISPEKGVHISVKIAKKTKQKLKIAGSISNETYWERSVKPKLNKNIKYVGLLPKYKIPQILRKAKAFIVPLQWEEPFGIAIVEAMACGTPVITFNRGSAPEVVVDGKTGFIVNTEKEMIRAIKNIEDIDRKECRKHVERNFTIKKMVDRYEEVYKKILERERKNR